MSSPWGMAIRTPDHGEAACSASRVPTLDLECGCNQGCLKKFPREEIKAHRLNMLEMEKEEREMLVMGVLLSWQYNSQQAKRGKRKPDWFRYCFQGEKNCVGAFRFLYHFGNKALRNLKKHVVEHGAVPRVHGNRGRRPHNYLPFPAVEHCASFIKSYSEEFGLPHPAPLHGRAEMPPCTCQLVRYTNPCMLSMLLRTKKLTAGWQACQSFAAFGGHAFPI